MSDWNWPPPAEPPTFEREPGPPEFLVPEAGSPAPPPPTTLGWPRRAAVGAAGLAALILAGVVGGVVGANLAEDAPVAAPALAGRPVVAPAPGSSSDEAVSRPAGSGTDVRAVLAKIEPAVVAIARQRPAGRRRPGHGHHPHSDGEVLTNAHVVEGARTDPRDTLRARTTPARPISSALDPGNDLALLKIPNASGLAAAELGSSADVGGGRRRGRHRQRPRAAGRPHRHPGHRLGPRSLARFAQRPDPDRRRHQPRQLRRPPGQRPAAR